MKLSVIYLNRDCPRNCSYCRIKHGLKGEQLSVDQWRVAFEYISEQSDFVIVLGNEPWMFGKDLCRIIPKHLAFKTAVYTSASVLFERHRDVLIPHLNNFSVGLDYPYEILTAMERDGFGMSDVEQKAWDAWHAFEWIRANHKSVDTHATITLSQANAPYLHMIIDRLSRMGVHFNINALHGALDKGFDFFPPHVLLEHNLIGPNSDTAHTVIDMLRLMHSNNPYFQNADMWNKHTPQHLLGQRWHCNGNPYGGLTVDADGSMRCCGYRPGVSCPDLNIFDLMESDEAFDMYTDAVQEDAHLCPGCSWSCPMMWHDSDGQERDDLIIKHKRTEGEQKYEDTSAFRSYGGNFGVDSILRRDGFIGSFA